jgi:hypothetical protein
MVNHSDTQKFLQAIFPDHAKHAIFANLNPAAHTRDFTGLDLTRDCYWSIAAFPNDGKATRTLARATEVRALVIDDVGTKVTEGAVRLALGAPTAVVETSAGNFQWSYRLATPVLTAAWGGFFAAIEQLIGVALEGRDAVHLFRLPCGVNSKQGRNGFKPRLRRLNPKIELSGIVPVTATVNEPAREAPGTLPSEALRELLALIPNKASIDREGEESWINIGHYAKGLCPEGREVFIDWTLTWQGAPNDPSKHTEESIGHSWDGFGSGGLLSQGGRLRAMAERINPEGFRQWKARTVFDDGEALLKPLEPSAKAVQPAPQVLASGEFVAGFVPPDYLVKKLITKAFLYSLTGQTGAGKTSITLRLAATVARGTSFGGLGTKPCRVLYLAAENPVDIQMRWIALGAEMGFDVDTIGVFFVRGWFKIGATMKELRAEALRVGGEFGLVVVDTGPVFFEGEDENDRVAMRRHARMMRDLIEVIPGKPTVIVNVHPVKNATVDTLTPSGGGSFLNEVDGNLTAAKNEDQTIELSWQGKWRGVEFAPLYFLLKTATHPRLIDSDGEAMPTVVCEHLSIDAKEVLEQAESVDQAKILAEMIRKPRNSLADLAIHMGWYYSNGKPDRSRMQRYVRTLTKQKSVKKHLQFWVVAGAAKSKLNGKGECIVSTDTIQADTAGMKEY